MTFCHNLSKAKMCNLWLILQENFLILTYSPITGNFRQAGDHLELSVETIQEIYGADSIELANELHKIAQVYFNG